MRRWILAIALLAFAWPAFGQSSQDLIDFDAPTAPDVVNVTTTYSGTSEVLVCQAYWTTTDAHTSIQQWQAQLSTNGGTSWQGPDSTSATYWTGTGGWFIAAFTSGTMEVRMRGLSANYGTIVSPSAWVATSNYTYAAPSVVSSITGPSALLSWSLTSGTDTASLVNAPGYSWWGNAASSSGAPSYNTGTLPASVIPAPTSGTLGGLKSASSVSHEWVAYVDTSGVQHQSQPAFSDISGTAPAASGGTGQTTYTDGQLLIGDSSTNGLDKATITAGTGITVTNGHGSITVAASGGSSSVPFPTYSGSTAYTAGNVVQGSDSNLYIAQTSTTGNNPVGDAGTHWKLHQLLANLTLNCGVGQTFADTFAVSSSAGGAMSPGLQTAINFIEAAVGAASPAVATVTLQQANNPTFSASANGSTTTIKTTTNIPIGASIEGLTGHNIGTTNTVTGSSFSGGTYTLTVGSWTSTVSGDTYVYAPYYGTNTITVNLPILGPNTTILGSTNTVAVPAFYPSVSAGGSEVGGWNNTYYFCITYTWTDSSGTTRETMPGPVTAQTFTTSNFPTVAGFTLPAGATGANLYASTSTSGTGMYEQGSFSVTSGVASSLTVAHPSSSTSAATSNPPASTYPCAMMWNGGNGFNFQAGLGLNLNGLMLYGSGASDSGIVIGSPSWLRAASLTVGSAIAVSDWGTNGIVANFGDYVAASSVQVDTCTNGIIATNESIISCANANAIRCSAQGVVSQVFSGVTATNDYVGFSSGGYLAKDMSYVLTTVTAPSSGTGSPTYGTTTASSPAVNTYNTANNSFITQ